MKKLLTLTAIGTAFVVSNANASGFNLREQSVSALGNAFAGATAGAEDISYSYFNPAGLTRHKGTQVNLNATLVAPRSKAKRATASVPTISNNEVSGYTGDIADPAVLPAGYMSYEIDPRWTAAISFNTPFGMTTNYDRLWSGRFHGTYSKVMTETITPMIAYKATCDLSLGAGFQVQYVRARLKNSALMAPGVEDYTNLHGDTVDIGYTLGALYEFSPETRIGLGYRSQIKHKLKGKIDFSKFSAMDQDISARLTTPAVATAGIYHDINNKWAVMAEVGQTYWSSFEELDIRGAKGLRSFTEEKWKDSTFYSVGANYTVNDKWKLRFGVGFDQSAVGTTYRTPRIPDGDRKWYSTGVEYKLDDKVTLNSGYTYIRANNGQVLLDGTHTGDARRGSLAADYENDIHIFGVGFNYEF